MTEPETAALVETVRDALTRWVHPEQNAIDPEVQRNLAALDALAQRLADAEAALEEARQAGIRPWSVVLADAEARANRAEEALREIAANEYDDSGDGPNYVSIARAALTPIEEPEHDN